MKESEAQNLKIARIRRKVEARSTLQCQASKKRQEKVSKRMDVSNVGIFLREWAKHSGDQGFNGCKCV